MIVEKANVPAQVSNQYNFYNIVSGTDAMGNDILVRQLAETTTLEQLQNAKSGLEVRLSDIESKINSIKSL